MDAEYAALALKIAAAYPSAYISDLTLADWTERLAEVDVDHATRMTKRLRNLPSAPDPKDWQIARLNTAETDYIMALPAGRPEEMTPEQRAKWEAVKAKLRDKPAGRSFPAALMEVPDAALEKPRFVLRRDMVCSGAGSYPAELNGVLCCPGCGEPLPDSSSSSEKSRL